jgi:hypothetical protein
MAHLPAATAPSCMLTARRCASGGLSTRMAWGNAFSTFHYGRYGVFGADLSARLGDAAAPVTIPLRAETDRLTPEGRTRQLPITVQHTKETLCLAHIYAAAGMAGVNVSQTVHDYGVDGYFVHVVQRGGRRAASGFSLDYQAKATVDWELKGESIVYDLEAKTYNDIVSRTKSETTLILLLLCLPKSPSDWHEASQFRIPGCDTVATGTCSRASPLRTTRPSASIYRPRICSRLTA